MVTDVKYLQKHHIINDELYTRRIVHTFSLGDIDEIDLYVAGAVYDWFEKDEKGQFCKKHGLDFVYNSNIDPNSFGWKVIITAMIPDRQWTIFQLKYSC